MLMDCGIRRWVGGLPPAMVLYIFSVTLLSACILVGSNSYPSTKTTAAWEDGSEKDQLGKDLPCVSNFLCAH